MAVVDIKLQFDKAGEPICIDLRKMFGDRYQIRWDEAHVPGDRTKANCSPWLMRIPCKRGRIYPMGGDRLIAQFNSDSSERILKLCRLGCELVQYHRGDSFAVLFPCRLFDDVAEVIGPKLKRTKARES